MSFNDITASCILIPIIAGLIKFTPASHLERSVLFFLCFGLLIDASNQLGYSDEVRKKVVAAYSLLECLFFLYVLSLLYTISIIKKSIKFFAALFVVWWVIAFYLLQNENEYIILAAKLYDMFYYMVVSFLAGYLLLKFIEKENPYQSPGFWFGVAIFTYCFTTFFLAAFIRDELAQKIWWAHNIMNILAYLLFTKAFLTIKKQNHAGSI